MEFVTFSTGFWDDKWVRGLSAPLKLLYIHLFTNSLVEHGFMEYDPEGWAAKTRLPVEEVIEGIQRFVVAGKVICEGDVLYMPNAIKHQRLKGNNLTGALDKVELNWSIKAPMAVLACYERYAKTNGVPTPYPRGSQSEHNNRTKQNKADQTTPPAQARAVRVKAKPPPLAELEAKINPCWSTGWALFKATVAEANSTGEVSESRLAKMLAHILERAEADKLSPQSLAHGLAEANSRGVPNPNYALKAAKGYRPETGARTGPRDFEAERRAKIDADNEARRARAVRG